MNLRCRRQEQRHEEADQRRDLLGLAAVRVVLALVAILASIIGALSVRTSTDKVEGALYRGLALAVVFVRRQRGLDEPLMDVRLFANRTFSGALGVFLMNRNRRSATR